MQVKTVRASRIPQRFPAETEENYKIYQLFSAGFELGYTPICSTTSNCTAVINKLMFKCNSKTSY
jgi:hypothetical protein